MGGPLPQPIRSGIVRYLLLHWTPQAISEELHCHKTTVYRIQENLFIYGSPFRPHFRTTGRPRAMHQAAKESLLEYVEHQPWAIQKEMVWYLWEEWGLYVHRPTVERLLKNNQLRLKQAYRVGNRQNKELRMHWIADLLHVTAEQLFFIDKTLFNKATG